MSYEVKMSTEINHSLEMEVLNRLQEAELFLFDFDGTLVEFDSTHLFEQALRILEILEHPKVGVERLEYGFSRFDFFHFIDEERFIREEFIETFWGHFAEKEIPVPTAFLGVRESLQHLKDEGKKVALVTSRAEPKEKIRRDLEACGLLEFVDFIEVRSKDNHGLHWSDKSPQIKLACKALGVEPHRAVMIGDVPPDAETARLAGVGLVILVLSGGVCLEVLEGAEPHLLLKGVHELKDLMRKI